MFTNVDHGQIAQEIMQNRRIQQEINGLEQQVAEANRRIANQNETIHEQNETIAELEKERDRWWCDKETAEAVIAARTQQLYKALSFLHLSNPTHLSDPNRKFRNFLDKQGQCGFTDYLSSKFPLTNKGYEIRPRCFTSEYTKRGLFSGSELEKCIDSKIQRMEQGDPDYFDHMYRYWSKPESEEDQSM